MRILLLFSLAVIVIITLIAELYLKQLGLGDPVRYDSNIFYGYSPKENQKKNRFGEAKVSINDVGLRSIYNWENNSKKKIVFLGDSVTYGGSYIDDKQLFSHFVCKELEEYICGNGGVNSYGIYNIVMRSKFDPRIQDADIFIYLFPPDDFLRNFRNEQSAHFYLNKKKFLFPAIMEAINYISTRYDINKYLSKFNDTEFKNSDFVEREFIDYSINILKDEINNKLQNNKKVLVFLSNRKDDKSFKNKINNYIKIELEKNINTHSLGNLLNKDEYFYDESVHLNMNGHRIVADHIVKKIKNIINKDND